MGLLCVLFRHPHAPARMPTRLFETKRIHPSQRTLKFSAAASALSHPCRPSLPSSPQLSPRHQRRHHPPPPPPPHPIRGAAASAPWSAAPAEGAPFVALLCRHEWDRSWYACMRRERVDHPPQAGLWHEHTAPVQKADRRGKIPQRGNIMKYEPLMKCYLTTLGRALHRFRIVSIGICKSSK